MICQDHLFLPLPLTLDSTFSPCFAAPDWSKIKLRGTTFIGHVIQFMARLSFIYASAMFSVVFLVQFENLDIRIWNFAILIMVLFTMFCYTLQLEWIGKTISAGNRSLPNSDKNPE